MMNDERVPAEVFPLGEFVKDEMKARGWSVKELAKRMGGDRLDINEYCLQLILHVDDVGMTLGEETARQLGKAFGTSHEVWMNIDEAWREYETRRLSPSSPPAPSPAIVTRRGRRLESRRGSDPRRLGRRNFQARSR